jgi:chemotaxis protein MotB
VVVCSLGLASCVSMGKYRKLETSNNALQKQYADAQAMNEKYMQEMQAIKDQQSKQSQQYDSMVSQLQTEINQGQMKITQFQNMLRVDAADKIFFDSGSATVKGSGKEVLKRLGEVLNQMPDKMVRIIGHTDNVGLMKSAGFKDNWDLSVARATSVARFLSKEAGVTPERLIASGRGEFAPIVPNDSPENRAKNRRIEILLVDKEAYERITPTPVPTAPAQ